MMETNECAQKKKRSMRKGQKRFMREKKNQKRITKSKKKYSFFFYK